MTCDGRPGPGRDRQDVRVTNDDEERENWSDDDEARKGSKVQSYMSVCVV